MPDGFDGYLALPGKPPAYAGTDFIVARNGRHCFGLSLFSTAYPELDSAATKHGMTNVCR